MPWMFWRLDTVIAPVEKEYDATVPSNDVVSGLVCEVMTTELPVRYANWGWTVKETDPPCIGARVTAKEVNVW